MPRCRDCKLYDLDAVKNARGAVMSNWVARCNWEPKALPESIRGRFKSLARQKRTMLPNVIHRCATFVQRTENG